MDHIPTLLPLPSDRTFIPSPDHENPRHVNTPIDDLRNTDSEERCQSVARQCCEIMGQSKCRACLRLERRLLNREKAERGYPRLRITQQNIVTTQIVKRLFPHLADSEIQDKIARGEIARGSTFLTRVFCPHGDDNDDDTDSDVSIDELKIDQSSTKLYGNELAPVAQVIVKTKKRQKTKTSEISTVVHSDNPIYALTKLKLKLKDATSSPLFFIDLKGIQSKILSGEVDRKKHLIKPPDDRGRLKSAISSRSTSSSNKSSLSKKGLKLAETLMPVFVSPRKVQICQEPTYKAYYEPPLLSKRRQIPNPSFFAGSSEAYSLPERLPDIIEFADSKIKALEKQGRSTSSMSFTSNFSDEAFDFDKNDPLSSSRKEFDKSEFKEGECRLGDSLSSSTPRLLSKSANGVIDENFAGEEEHAKQEANDKNGTKIFADLEKANPDNQICVPPVDNDESSSLLKSNETNQIANNDDTEKANKKHGSRSMTPNDLEQNVKSEMNDSENNNIECVEKGRDLKNKHECSEDNFDGVCHCTHENVDDNNNNNETSPTSRTTETNTCIKHQENYCSNLEPNIEGRPKDNESVLESVVRTQLEIETTEKGGEEIEGSDKEDRSKSYGEHRPNENYDSCAGDENDLSDQEEIFNDENDLSDEEILNDERELQYDDDQEEEDQEEECYQQSDQNDENT